MSVIERTPYEACPLCGDEAILDIGTYDCTRHPLYHPPLPPTISWCECYRCHHVFTDGYFEGSAAAEVMSRVSPSQVPGNAPHRDARWRAVVDRVGACCSRPGGEWLDVGFGDGSLLQTAQNAGFAVSGIDLRQESVERLARLGIPARRAALESLEEQARYAVISLADVLEHMPFPRPALEQARRLLAPLGILFVSLPEFGSLAWKELDGRRSNPYWTEIEHYHNFSRPHLEEVLRQTNFEPLWHHPNGRYLCGLDVAARRVAS